jgi:hypothetical protein
MSLGMRTVSSTAGSGMGCEHASVVRQTASRKVLKKGMGTSLALLVTDTPSIQREP